MGLLHFYRIPALSSAKKSALLSAAQQKVSRDIRDVETEYCFNIEAGATLTGEDLRVLRWLLAETFQPGNFSDKSFLVRNNGIIARSETTKQSDSDKVVIASSSARNDGSFIIEVGPRMNFTTAWSTNAVSVCHACGLKKIKRVERSRRYKFIFGNRSSMNNDQWAVFYSSLTTDDSSLLYDRMTECPYPEAGACLSCTFN